MSLFSQAYWNDQEIESKKPAITHAYLRDSGLEHHFHEMFYRAELPVVCGRGLDIACGNGWSSALLRKYAYASMTAIDFSEHRVKQVGYPTQPVIGDFHHLPFPDQHFDFVWMCQAFHHSHEPQRLLAECRRVLRPKGFIVICGEAPVRAYWKLAVRLGLIRVDISDGDHFYTMREYLRLLKPARVVSGETYTGFVVRHG